MWCTKETAVSLRVLYQMHLRAYVKNVMHQNVNHQVNKVVCNLFFSDLPGYHYSGTMKIPKNKVAYLSAIRDQFDILKMRKFIILSPSMSGGYSIPYAFAGSALFN